MKIIAHRGVTNNAPENTMAAFLDAARQGYGVECDIRLTRDGVPVILHDDSLKRAAKVDRKLSDIDAQELEEIQIEGQHPIPTLDTVIKYVLPETFVNFNVKEDTAVEPALELLKGAEPAHGFLFSAHSILAVSRLKADFSQTAFVHSWLPAAFYGAVRSRTKILVCRDWRLNSLFFKLLSKNGWSVYVWGRAPDAHRMRAKGVAGLIKDI